MINTDTATSASHLNVGPSCCEHSLLCITVVSKLDQLAVDVLADIKQEGSRSCTVSSAQLCQRLLLVLHHVSVLDWHR